MYWPLSPMFQGLLFLTSALDFSEDVGPFCAPLVPGGVQVSFCKVVGDGVGEFLDALKAAMADDVDG